MLLEIEVALLRQMVLIEFLKHWNYVELHLVELVVGHIYLPLDAL
jgi:hypothetical protein